MPKLIRASRNQALRPWRAGLALLLALPLALTLSPPVEAEAGPVPLQPLLDRAAAGSTVTLPAGSYAGPAVIAKPLTLRMEPGGELLHDGEEPAITLQADGIVLEGLTVTDRQTDPEIPAVLVASSGNKLRSLTIHTSAGGVYLRQADRNELTGIRIDGPAFPGRGNPVFSQRGNGIDLFESHRNTIAGSRIERMHDGIYVESSDANRLERNEVNRSRYGYHFMFAEGAALTDNTGAYNVTGAMLMGVQDGEVLRNRFAKQTENVNSQGLLLFDVKRTVVKDNRVEGNRVGFYVEQTEETEMTGNEVARNFIGLQLLDSTRNTLSGNAFVSNVIQAQATGSPDNRSDGNYWDNAQGLDRTGSGVSDLSYEVNPFFLNLTKSVPAFQVLFQSPGMPFLEQLFRSGTDEWLKDNAPLMKPPTAVSAEAPGNAREPAVFWTGMLLLAVSFISIYQWGVKRP
ncbi:NosD protein [Paenibacillus sp. J31TS4]|uniref:right-handed parallel beta-helix repeat-containing protein n=1 Tax=Paenibacillus sp. J31TS4 TaxID=2807195 RepID=UPI001B2D0235|nr:NosD domain-containing protein [Paenibacillus sp. J31TS4]GIP40437.1 NosD protein [Paenibacillus sp. J31TS4]